MLIHFTWPKLLHHRLLQQLSNRLGLLLVHCRLIGNSNLIEHGIGIKASRNGLFKVFQKRFLVTTVNDVIGDHIGLFHVLDANVIFAETGRGDGFFVFVLSVNDRRQSLALMHIDGVPNLGDPGAGGVDDFDVLFIKVTHLFVGGTKGWQDDDVSLLNVIEILFAFSQLFNQIDIVFRQTIVHFRVVNEFVGNVKFAIGIMFDGFVGQGDTSFDAPAESKVLGKIHFDTILVQYVIARFQIVDETRLELLLNIIFDLIAYFFESTTMELIGFHKLQTFFLFRNSFHFGGFFFGCRVQWSSRSSSRSSSSSLLHHPRDWWCKGAGAGGTQHYGKNGGTSKLHFGISSVSLLLLMVLLRCSS
mmetsp:Transcript_34794/g.54320  ORF Transcript_34794/g.54320 Transcript_34794/m.54320 type:complete len:360 (-) Transcript_34794:249-1328(-)